MLEEVRKHIAQLKNLVSLKYVDPPMREQCFCVIASLQQDQKSVLFCRDYVIKIEESHEKMMGEVSQFLDLLAPSMNDWQHHLQYLQQEISENIKYHDREIQDHQNNQRYLNAKLDSLSTELQDKDEEIRELNSRLEEREALIEANEREEREYLNKIQMDFEKQQKALEEALLIIAHKDEDIRKLQQQISLLREPETEEKNQRAILIVSNRKEAESSMKSSLCQARSDDQCSLVQCSLVSSRNLSEGLEQFEYLKLENRSEEVQGSLEMEGMQRPETLRQMLNLSIEKQYKLQYNNKCDSVEQRSKQNCPRNWMKNSKSRSEDKKAGWAVNQSLEMMEKNEKNQIKQFRLLPAGSLMKVNNPYYHYFLIASQNVKIKSKHFQAFSQVSTEKEWRHLSQMRVPLHCWEEEIERFLMEECSLE